MKNIILIFCLLGFFQMGYSQNQIEKPKGDGDFMSITFESLASAKAFNWDKMESWMMEFSGKDFALKMTVSLSEAEIAEKGDNAKMTSFSVEVTDVDDPKEMIQELKDGVLEMLALFEE